MIKQLFQLIHCTVALTQCQPGIEDDLHCIQSEKPYAPTGTKKKGEGDNLRSLAADQFWGFLCLCFLVAKTVILHPVTEIIIN